MARPAYDLPFDKDATGRFLPWLVAFMVFLGTLATAGTLATGVLLERWQGAMQGTLTIQVPPGPDVAADPLDDFDLQALRDVLDRADGVLQARIVPRDELEDLLAPWLGSSDVMDALPLPRLLDVEMDPESPPDLEQLKVKAQALFPGARLDDHRVWLSRLVKLAEGLRNLTWALLGLVVLVTGATVIFATRSSLSVHRPVIEVLHQIGARDRYIARQFAGHTRSLALRGAVVGFAVAAPAILALQIAGAALADTLLGFLRVDSLGWMALAGVPLGAILLSSVTARLTAHRVLSGMM